MNQITKRIISWVLALIMMFGYVAESGIQIKPKEVEAASAGFNYSGDGYEFAKVVASWHDGIIYNSATNALRDSSGKYLVNCTGMLTLPMNEYMGGSTAWYHVNNKPSGSGADIRYDPVGVLASSDNGMINLLCGQANLAMLNQTYNKYGVNEGSYLTVSGNGHSIRYYVARCTGSLPSDYKYWAEQADKIPGSIVIVGSHVSISLGYFPSDKALFEAYPVLRNARIKSSGGGYYQISNARNYGPTVMNQPNQGKDQNTTHACVILIADTTVTEKEPPKKDFTIYKKDTSGNNINSSVTFQLFKQNQYDYEYARTITFNGSKTISLEPGNYKLIETKAPSGYVKGNDVYFNIPNDDEVYVYNDINWPSVNASFSLNKKDGYTGEFLGDTVLNLYQYNIESVAYDKYEYVGKLESDGYSFRLPNGYHDCVSGKNKLQATAKNQGKFKIVEVAPQPGYVNEGHVIYMDLTKDPTMDKELSNNKQLGFTIRKEDMNGKGLQGAVFELSYGPKEHEKIYRGTSDSNGYITFKFVDVGVKTATLKEVEAPPKHLINEQFQKGVTVNVFEVNGQQISLQDNSYFGNGTANPYVVKNKPIRADYGKIIIEKHDGDNRGELVPGAIYALYSDPECTQALPGFERLVNTTGRLEVDGVPLGTCYLKEIQAPDGYALQLEYPDGKDYYEINVEMSNDADPIVYTPANVMDYKQDVELNLFKKSAHEPDKNTPVKGAVYELRAKDAINIHGYSFKPNEAIGRYVTDSQGKIKVTTLGSDVISGKGTDWSEVLIDHLGEPLPNGSYYFVEIEAPDGYKINPEKIYVDATWESNDRKEDVTIGNKVVSALGSKITCNAVTQDEPYKTIVEKVDENGTPLKGATLAVIQDVNGVEKVIDQWVSDGNPHYVYGLESGRLYSIREIKAPDGYALQSNDVTFRYKPNEDNEFTIENIKSSLEIKKIEANDVTETPIAGAGMQIIDSNGKTVQNWTSENSATTIGGLQDKTEYTLTDKGAPPAGYASGSIKFTTNNSLPIQNVVLPNKPIVVKIVKLDDKDQPLAGAKLKLVKASDPDDAEPVKTADGVVCEWISTNSEEGFIINKLPIGEYKIVEIEPPAGYNKITKPKVITVQDITTAQTFSLTNRPLELKLIKVDENGKPLAGAELGLFKETGEGPIKTWTSTDSEEGYVIKGLPVGKYYVKETKAPKGYVPSTFSVEIKGENGIDEIKLPNQPISYSFKKVDAQTQEMLKGVHLKIVGANQDGYLPTPNDQVVEIDGVKCEWVTDGNVKTFNKFPLGTYFLVEDEPLIPGYTKAEPEMFTVSEVNPVYTITIKNKPTQVIIDKVDENKHALSGAQLTIVDRTTKEPVNIPGATWESDGSSHKVLSLPAGDYTLVETKAPNGYHTNTLDFTVELTPLLQRFTLENHPIVIEILKTAEDGQTPLSGAELELIDSEGKSIRKWTSTTTPEQFEGLCGTYTLKELKAPDGYVLVPEYQFTVDGNGIVKNDGDDMVVKGTEPIDPVDSIHFKNQKKKLFVTKVDINDQPIANAVLQIVTENNEPVSIGDTLLKWTSTKEAYEITGIPKGNYILKEIIAPDGYASNSKVFTVTDTIEEQQLELIDEPIVVKAIKVDENDNPMAGVKMRITDMDGTIVTLPSGKCEWTTTTNWKVFNNFPTGKYILEEVEAPAGYTKADNVEFEVKDTAEEQTVKMTNTLTEIEIKKEDKDGNPLKGAHLRLIDAKGNVISTKDGEPCEWISDGTAKKFVGVPAGNYTLDETKAPDGYVKASKPITVTDQKGVQTFVLPNGPLVVEILKVDENGNAIEGAELQLIKADGSVVDTWTSGKTAHKVNNVVAGVYTIHEVKAPDGYATAPDKTVTIVESTSTAIEFENKPIDVYIDKVDKEGLSLKGAHMQLLDATTREVVVINDKKCEWISDGTMKHLEGINPGKYILSESKAPDGYVANEMTIEVLDNSDRQEFKLENAQYQMHFVKVDETGKVQTGAYLQIVDGNGKLVSVNGQECTWISQETPHLISGLKNGKYTLVETKAPTGYYSNKIDFVVDNTAKDPVTITLTNQPLKVVIDKIDALTNTPVKGADLVILTKDKEPLMIDGVVQEWTSNGESHVITHIPAGDYYLREQNAPDGYYRNAEDVEFTVKDNGPETIEVKVEMRNYRTMGSLKLYKADTNTNKPLKGVTFEIVSVNKVVDPATEEVVFEANQVVDRFTTDRNGNGQTTKELPIGVYNNDGTLTPIEYVLREVEVVAGQYHPLEDMPFVFGWQNDEQKIVEVNFDLTNDSPIIKVIKTVESPKTFVGKYEDKHDVTVVKHDDEIIYNIVVSNTGSAAAKNIVIRDKIPENTKYVSMDNAHHGEYDVNANTVYWTVDEVKPGEVITLRFTVKVTSTGASEIVNIAQYDYPDKLPEKPEDALTPKNPDNNWKDTDAVVHQTVEFHKISKVPGGSTKDNAVSVKVGDTIRYELSFITTNVVKNVIVTDPIPQGLTYVQKSAKIVTPDGKETEAKIELNPETNIITFPAINAAAGTTKFIFDVTVDPVAKGDEFTYYVNKAEVELDKNDVPEKETIPSEEITHKTNYNFTVEKHGTPKTFEGTLSENKDFTGITTMKKDEIIEYQIVVKNTGSSDIPYLKVVDKVPTGLSFVKQTSPEGTKYSMDESTQTMTWILPVVKVGETLTITFQGKVMKQEAQLIVNQAFYTDKPEGDLDKTDEVVHQVVEFHKTSIVNGGTNHDDATPVSVDDVITYILQFKTKGALTNVTVKDKIPEGLTYVDGSVFTKSDENDQWTSIDDETALNEDGNLDVTFENVAPGTYYVKFDAKVDFIPANTEKFFDNKGDLTYDKVPGTPDKTEDLTSEVVSHMTETKIVGEKTGEVKTYVGPYDARENVAVVKNEDIIRYTISVKNTGMSKIKNVVIRDTIPEFTTFVEVHNEGKYDAKTNTVKWIVPMLNPNEVVKVTFSVKVNTTEAVEIRNKAEYTTPKDTEDIPEDSWIETEEVIHQTSTLHKKASIESGTDKESAKYVKVGQEYSYIIEFESKNPVYGLVVTDKLPEYVKFVEGSSKVILPDGSEKKISAHVTDGKLVFDKIEETLAGKMQFVFDVKVTDIPESEKDYYIINKADATHKESKDSDVVIDLTTEEVTHKVRKETDPKLGFEGSDESSVWMVISLMSLAAMIILMTTNRKKKF